MNRLKVAFVTSEAVPFAKTGGLADVSGVLPDELCQAGLDCRMIMPYYGIIKKGNFRMKDMGIKYPVKVGEENYGASLYETDDKSHDFKTYLVDSNTLFNRSALYVDPETSKDYSDNDDRFIFFCKAVLELFKQLNWKPDIIHANDWQSALVVSLLNTFHENDKFYNSIKTILTIHNMAYQGIFPADTFLKLNISKSYFAPQGPFEYWEKINFLKSAVAYADKITTVSPTYAREIQSSNEYGMGLEGVLKARTKDLVGILNGVDYDIWSPKKDKLILYNYFAANLSNKKRNKLELLDKTGMPLRVDQPLIGMISRLDSQKGFDIIAEVIDDILALDLQFVLLGTGAKEYHMLFEKLEHKYSDRLKAFLTFDNSLAHLIEAGADIFLMPSRFEPCGLNQLYSLKYGTVPIVRKTGGLADTVEDFDPEKKRGTGFVFEKYDSQELLVTIKRAVATYYKRRLWFNVVKQGMAKDFSWNRAAEKYINLYNSIIN